MAKACADAIAVDRERGTKKKKKKSRRDSVGEAQGLFSQFCEIAGLAIIHNRN
jgi:hypothetical protein